MDLPLARLSKWFTTRRAECRLAVRMTAGALLSYLLAEAFHLPQGYWAVFTALIVTQASVGGSIAMGVDRITGTVGGVVYAAIIIMTMRHDTPATMMLAILVTLLPLTLLAAVRASFKAAPVTAAILLLAPVQGLGVLTAAADRVLEIFVGTLVGVAVSLLVFPARAHALVAENAAKTLRLFASLLAMILEKKSGDRDTAPLHAKIRTSVTKVETLATEARHERENLLKGAPDPDPLGRTLRRLRGDFVMMERAMTAPLPPELDAQLIPVIGPVVQAAVDFLTAGAANLTAAKAPPSLEPVEAAVHAYGSAITELRREGLTRALSDDQVSRLFTLGFAFDQMRQNFRDLAARIDEFSKG